MENKFYFVTGDGSRSTWPVSAWKVSYLKQESKWCSLQSKYFPVLRRSSLGAFRKSCRITDWKQENSKVHGAGGLVLEKRKYSSCCCPFFPHQVREFLIVKCNPGGLDRTKQGILHFCHPVQNVTMGELNIVVPRVMKLICSLRLFVCRKLHNPSKPIE